VAEGSEPGARLGGLLGRRFCPRPPGCFVRGGRLARRAQHELRVPRLELYVEPWNAASIRTAERAGSRREGLLRGWQEVGGERKDMLMHARLPTDPSPRIP
jgi:hypothetical protein